jgi:hypothetical protein
MRPQSRVWRKDGRNSAHRHTEHQLPNPRKMTAKELIAEAEEILARQAHLDRPEANMLGVLLIGCENVEVITLTADDELSYPDAIPGEAEVIGEEIHPISPELLRDAKGWLEDCFEDLPASLSATEIVNGVQRFYSGGWQGFMQDSSYRN